MPKENDSNLNEGSLPISPTKKDGMDGLEDGAARLIQEAEERCAEAERKLKEVMEECEQRVQAVESRAEKKLATRLRECDKKLQQFEAHWKVDKDEIQLTGPELGRGAWATVSVATFRGLRVAAKCIHNTIISPYNIKLFKREMEMAARIRHPNLLQFIGATLDGEMIILMELMPTSLRKELEKAPKLLPLNEVASIAGDVARALNYLHLMKPHPLIHRDISSANVLLQPLPNRHWKAKVSDFGTVKFIKDIITRCPGTPSYSALEADDPSKQSPKMDIFSFGILLMEMVTGEFPDIDERKRQLSQISFDHKLLPLIRMCLSQDLDVRPSASDIIEELDSYIN